MEENKKSWGGSRTGAGRKCAGKEPRVTMACMVDPETKQKLTKKAEELGVSLGKLMDRLAAQM